MRNLILAFILGVIGLVSGCASVPMASPEADIQAKQFVVSSGKANVYIYRNENFGGAIAMPVSLDGRVIGRTGPMTYFQMAVEPGHHEIASLTESTAKIEIDAKANQNHFIWQEVKMGMWQADSKLHEVNEEEGRKGVLECNLIDSSAK